jgi:hypothetical protein
MWSSMYIRKEFLFVAFVASVGIVGLLITWVLRVAITGVWSDDSSWLDSIWTQFIAIPLNEKV